MESLLRSKKSLHDVRCKNIKEEKTMTGFEKMLEMLTEACKTAYGSEWDNMTDKQKHDIIMGFIATAAHNAK